MSWCLADVVEAHGDVGLSGGYGLWGPAIGNTIYPDLQPTVENVIIEDSLPIPPEVIQALPTDGAMIDTEVTPATPIGGSLAPTGSSFQPSYTAPLPSTSNSAPAPTAAGLQQPHLAPAGMGNPAMAQSGFSMPATGTATAPATAQVNWLQQQAAMEATKLPTPQLPQAQLPQAQLPQAQLPQAQLPQSPTAAATSDAPASKDWPLSFGLKPERLGAGQ